ncbi:NADH dehydrogenase [ubiquinone] 1 beta subcomplex subunit 1 [Lemmus lemmus]
MGQASCHCPWLQGPAWNLAVIKVNLLQLIGDSWVHILVPVGLLIKCCPDRKDDEQLTAFWNKSMLFQRELRPKKEIPGK